jgi:hypothetical protein
MIIRDLPRILREIPGAHGERSTVDATPSNGLLVADKAEAQLGSLGGVLHGHGSAFGLLESGWIEHTEGLTGEGHLADFLLHGISFLIAWIGGPAKPTPRRVRPAPQDAPVALVVREGSFEDSPVIPAPRSCRKSLSRMAEGVGFEPTGRVNGRRFSRPLLSLPFRHISPWFFMT